MAFGAPSRGTNRAVAESWVGCVARISAVQQFRCRESRLEYGGFVRQICTLRLPEAKVKSMPAKLS
jgi:hypothetical protein